MADWRDKRSPAFVSHLRQTLGRDPTDADVAGAIGFLEHGTDSGRRAVVSSFWGRQQTEGGPAAAHARHYDPVALGHRWDSLTADKIAPYSAYYGELASGSVQPSVKPGQTHFFSPAGMDAYYKKNPSLVRSSVRMDVPGYGPALVPNWATKAVSAGDYTDVGGEWFLTPNERYGQQPVAQSNGAASTSLPAMMPAQVKQGESKMAEPKMGGTKVTLGGPAKSAAGDKMRMALVEQLLNNKLSASPTAFEGIANALGKAVGTYSGYQMANQADQRQQAALEGLPEHLRAIAALDPVAARTLQVQQMREDATAKREDQRHKTTLDREDRRASANMQLEWAKHTLKQAGEVNDGKNWEISRRGNLESWKNKVTGETRTYRGGALVEGTPGQSQAAPMPGVPAVPVNSTIAAPNQPAQPQIQSPAIPQPQQAGGSPNPVSEPPVMQQAAMGGPMPSAIPTQAPNQAPGNSGLPADINGLEVRPDGKFSSALGFDYRAVDKQGKPLPGYIFKSPNWLYTQDPKQAEHDYTAAVDGDKEASKGLRGNVDLFRKTESALARTEQAIANGVKTGRVVGPAASAVRNVLSSLGVEVANQTDDQLIQASSNLLLPAIRAGFPGAVSNFEMEQYLKSVAGLGNTPEANFMIVHFMKRSGEVAKQEEALASKYKDLKRKAGLPTHIDDGFRDYLADHYQQNPVFSDRDRELVKLAGQGVKLKDLMEYRDGKDSPLLTPGPKIETAPQVAPKKAATPQVIEPTAKAASAPADADNILTQARDAIARGANKDAVIARLKEKGYPVEGI